MTTILLPQPDGSLKSHRIGPASPYPEAAAGAFPRTVYAAAHVVADPVAGADPWQKASLDWDATLAFRRHLWGLGFRIAEAMDTSQRGMGFDLGHRTGTDPPLDPGGTGGRRGPRLGGRHGPPRSRGRAGPRRRDPRL
jgi:hypothetical protein